MAGSTVSIKTASGGDADRLRTDRLAAEKPQLQVPLAAGMLPRARPDHCNIQAQPASELPWRQVGAPANASVGLSLLQGLIRGIRARLDATRTSNGSSGAKATPTTTTSGGNGTPDLPAAVSTAQVGCCAVYGVRTNLETNAGRCTGRHVVMSLLACVHFGRGRQCNSWATVRRSGRGCRRSLGGTVLPGLSTSAPAARRMAALPAETGTWRQQCVGSRSQSSRHSQQQQPPELVQMARCARLLPRHMR